MNLTPAEQSRLEQLDAMIEAANLAIAPVKAERARLLAYARHRAFRQRRKDEEAVDD